MLNYVRYIFSIKKYIKSIPVKSIQGYRSNFQSNLFSK